MLRFYIFLFAVLSILFSFSQKTGTALFTGKVLQPNGKPVPFATITSNTGQRKMSADSLGVFSLSIQQGELLSISAIGFADTVFITSQSSYSEVVLRPVIKNLAGVSVKMDRQPFSPQDEPNIINREIIGNSIADYKAGNQLTNGTINTYTVVPGGVPRTSSYYKQLWSNTAPVMSRFYNGALLPVMKYQESTHGSPYLFDTWGTGYVINMNGQLMNGDNFFFNFDKLGQNLLISPDKKMLVEVDKNLLQSFVIEVNGFRYSFAKKTVKDKIYLFQVLSPDSAACQLFKLNKTKFEKANYVSTGLTETGHNYDLYSDTPEYYVYISATKQWITVALKKKQIKEAFFFSQQKVENYFSNNRDKPVDENFLIKLVANL